MIIDERASADDPPLACPECGVSPDEGCEHVLALIDVTFGYCCDGYAYDRWDEFAEIAAEAFRGFLCDGTHPDWDSYQVQEVWDEMIAQGYGLDEGVTLGGSPLTRLIGDVLWEADAMQLGTSLIAASGGRCESAMRLLYSDDPAATCDKAKTILKEWLVKEKEKPKKRTRRKKR